MRETWRSRQKHKVHHGRSEKEVGKVGDVIGRPEGPGVGSGDHLKLNKCDHVIFDLLKVLNKSPSLPEGGENLAPRHEARQSLTRGRHNPVRLQNQERIPTIKESF